MGVGSEPRRNAPPGHCVLVVEDDPDSLDLLLTMLRHAGEDAIGVSTAEEALVLLGERPFAFLVCDHNLPGMSGSAMLERAIAGGLARADRSVICTADPFVRAPEGVALLRKPIRIAELRDLVTAGASAPIIAAPPLSLVLYVADTVPSTRARANLERALAAVKAVKSVDLKVHDLRREPLSAEPDRIRFTPTLVRVHPAPRKMVVGDLRDEGLLRALFEVSTPVRDTSTAA